VNPFNREEAALAPGVLLIECEEEDDDDSRGAASADDDEEEEGASGRFREQGAWGSACRLL
jgi:hypothetical protein